MLNLLKAKTKSHHDRLELRLDLLVRLRDRTSYLTYLERVYGYYEPLEQRLASIVLEDLELEVRAGQKTAWLVHDLRFFKTGSAPLLSSIPRCRALPALRTAPQALGCLYVIEGATLGGQVIMRHVQTVLGITADTGGRFFTGYGHETSKRWSDFREVICSYVDRRPDDIGAIIDTARDTFSTFERWLCDGTGDGRLLFDHVPQPMIPSY